VTLQYRVIVVQTARDRFEAYVRAFPQLNVSAATAIEAVEAARAEIARTLSDYAKEGRLPPQPDREAVAIELIDVPFEPPAEVRTDVRLDVITGKVYKDGSEVPVRGAALALLVSLASEPRDLSIDVLCDRLYPGISADQAYGALKMCVYRARKQLGVRGVIETTPRGYRLAENVVIDTRFLPQIVRAVRTRSIAKAIETRLDAIFEQLLSGRPAAYATWEWFEPVERSFRDAAREIGLHLAGDALEENKAQRALEIAHAIAALDPLDEVAHELQIRAHLARGDRASALQIYRRYARDLQEQHGMEPSSALRSLVEAAP